MTLCRVSFWAVPLALPWGPLIASLTVCPFAPRPAEVLSSVNQVSDHVDTTVTQTSQTINAFTQPIISTTGSVAQQLMNDYRAMGQQLAQSYQNLGQQFLSSVGAVSGQMGALGNQLTPILDAYETQYCTPAKFTPSVKKPAKFTGPSFELSFNAGLCFLDDEALMCEYLFITKGGVYTSLHAQTMF